MPRRQQTNGEKSKKKVDFQEEPENSPVLSTEEESLSRPEETRFDSDASDPVPVEHREDRLARETESEEQVPVYKMVQQSNQSVLVVESLENKDPFSVWSKNRVAIDDWTNWTGFYSELWLTFISSLDQFLAFFFNSLIFHTFFLLGSLLCFPTLAFEWVWNRFRPDSYSLVADKPFFDEQLAKVTRERENLLVDLKKHYRDAHFSVPVARFLLLVSSAAYQPLKAQEEIKVNLGTALDDPELELSSRGWEGAISQVLYSRKHDLLVISYKGTSPLNFTEWLIDTTIRKISVGGILPGLVHSGFFNSLRWASEDRKGEVSSNQWDDIQIALKKLVNQHTESEGRKLNVWITGHSLGAATSSLVASILTWRLGKTGWDDFMNPSVDPEWVLNVDFKGAYTFGSPAAGDTAFAETMNFTFVERGVQLYRVANSLDLVTHVPFVKTKLLRRLAGREGLINRGNRKEEPQKKEEEDRRKSKESQLTARLARERVNNLLEDAQRRGYDRDFLQDLRAVVDGIFTKEEKLDLSRRPEVHYSELGSKHNGVTQMDFEHIGQQIFLKHSPKANVVTYFLSVPHKPSLYAHNLDSIANKNLKDQRLQRKAAEDHDYKHWVSKIYREIDRSKLQAKERSYLE